MLLYRIYISLGTTIYNNNQMWQGMKLYISIDLFNISHCNFNMLHYFLSSTLTLCLQYYMNSIKHANHMTMTTSGQIMSWPDYLKTKGNVNIKLWDLFEILIVYILLSTFQSVHMALTVNKPCVRRFIAWIESADWNPCQCSITFCFIRLYLGVR